MRIMNENMQLALDTLERKSTMGIPTSCIHIMQHSVIERIAGDEPGTYMNDPHGSYIRMQQNIGTSLLDQYLSENPLSMSDLGYEEGTGRSATTGGTAILDSIVIDSPEAVAEQIERYEYARLKKEIENFNEANYVQSVINQESLLQHLIGPNILKAGYGQARFPGLEYFRYGYENYFMAYALYPELIEQVFKLQADYAVLCNKALVKAYRRAGLPLYHRLDWDMADSSGLLVSMKSLESLWLPHFRRAIEPLADAKFNLIWHSDGNLMQLYPYLIECGINGFQGFQYECGMDYMKICKLKDREGHAPILIAGVSVTRTLPFGTPDDVKNELRFIVENGPRTGLFLATSSSITPGVPWDNIKMLIEGLKYYRDNGRKYI